MLSYQKYMRSSHQGLHLFYFLIFFSVLSLGQSAWAVITIASGGGQQVIAGSPSAGIFFKVQDALGQPNTGATLSFQLVDPTGNPVTGGLSNSISVTDNAGLATTRLNPTGNVGNYTVTATLTTDMNQLASTNIVVVAGAATQLTIVAGSNQSITVGKNSGSITFKLTDTFNNPILGKSLHFTVQKPTGETSNNDVFPNTAITDVNGQVTTRLEAVQTPGIYTVTALLDTNNTISTSTTIEVTEALPQLPALGLGTALNSFYEIMETEANFYGGTSVNDGPFNQEVVVERDKDSVLIKGIIEVEPRHIGLKADIILLAIYSAVVPFTEQWFYIVDQFNNIILWDGDLATLVPFKTIESLSSKEVINMYGGTFAATGQLEVYFGYRLEDGLIVYNIMPMKILVK